MQWIALSLVDSSNFVLVFRQDPSLTTEPTEGQQAVAKAEMEKIARSAQDCKLLTDSRTGVRHLVVRMSRVRLSRVKTAALDQLMGTLEKHSITFRDCFFLADTDANVLSYFDTTRYAFLTGVVDKLPDETRSSTTGRYRKAGW